MPTVASYTTQLPYTGALSLAEYAQTVQYYEDAFWGVNRPAAYPQGLAQYACRTIWTKDERDRIAHYLREAQYELERFVGFPLGPTYITNEVHDERSPITTHWARVVRGGQRAVTVIQASAPIIHAADPAIITVVTTVTDEAEIYLYHIGTDIQIMPSQITIVGGSAVIYVPRARLVRPEYADNPPEGWEYTDLTYFAEEVDVKRVYTDSALAVELVREPGVRCVLGCDEEISTDACLYVKNGRLGIVDVQVTQEACSFCYANKVRLHYLAGYALTPEERETLVRLAHSKLPVEPCGCDILADYWRRDREVPTVLTAERINCPFGMSNAAWTVYSFASQQRVMRGQTLGLGIRPYAWAN